MDHKHAGVGFGETVDYFVAGLRGAQVVARNIYEYDAMIWLPILIKPKLHLSIKFWNGLIRYGVSIDSKLKSGECFGRTTELPRTRLELRSYQISTIGDVYRITTNAPPTLEAIATAMDIRAGWVLAIRDCMVVVYPTPRNDAVFLKQISVGSGDFLNVATSVCYSPAIYQPPQVFTLSFSDPDLLRKLNASQPSD